MTPPNEAGPRDITPEGTDNILTSTPATAKKQVAASDSNGACGRCRASGLRRDLWREGFGYGFRDALRLAAREISDPAVRVVLDQLADYYRGAADRRAS